MREEELEAINVVMKINIEEKPKIPKRRLLDAIENDTRTSGIYKGDVRDRVMWKFRIRVADPKLIR